MPRRGPPLALLAAGLLLAGCPACPPGNPRSLAAQVGQPGMLVPEKAPRPAGFRSYVLGDLAPAGDGTVYGLLRDAVVRETAQGMTVLAGVLDVTEDPGGAAPGADGAGPAARFNGPQGVVLDDVGRLYVADTGNARIRRVTPQGEVSTFVEGERDGLGLAGPTDLAFDGQGGLLIADPAAGRIVRIGPDGARSRFAPTVLEPRRLAPAPDGSWYVLEGKPFEAGFDPPANRARRIVRLDAAGVALPFPEGTTFRAPSDVAVDPAGRLHVADNLPATTILRLEADGTRTTIVDEPYADEPGVRFELACTPPGSPLAYDYRIAFGPDGTLYFHRQRVDSVLTVSGLR